MNKQIHILINYLLYFILGLIICIIGISNVFADTETNIGYLSDKSDIHVSVTYQTESNAPLPVPKDREYYIPGIWGININVSNYNFSANTIYEIELDMPLNTFNNNVNNVSVTGGSNSGCSYISHRRFDTNYPRVRFSCTNGSNGLSVNIQNTNHSNIVNGSTFRWNYTYLILINVDSVDNTIIEQNNQIIHQNDIIIENQDKNTKEIIDNQNNLLGSKCDNLVNPSESVHASILNNSSSSSLSNDNRALTTSWIKVDKNTTYYLSGDYNRVRWQLKSGSTIVFGGGNISINTGNADELRLYYYYQDSGVADSYEHLIAIRKVNSYCEYGSFTSKLDDTNSAINGVTNALTDDSAIDISSLSNTAGWLPPGPIDSIINLPLTMFNNLLVSLNGTCTPLNIPLPYVNKNLPIPCINTIFNQIEGLPNFWNWVGVIASVVILYRYLIALYDYYDKMTTLQANYLSDFGGVP